MRRMLITLVFLVVAKKSKTFISFLCSGDEQAYRTREGAQPDREPSWPVEIFHTIDIMLIL